MAPSYHTEKQFYLRSILRWRSSLIDHGVEVAHAMSEGGVAGPERSYLTPTHHVWQTGYVLRRAFCFICAYPHTCSIITSGGKAKPLKAPKKAAKELDEVC